MKIIYPIQISLDFEGYTSVRTLTFRAVTCGEGNSRNKSYFFGLQITEALGLLSPDFLKISLLTSLMTKQSTTVQF